MTAGIPFSFPKYPFLSVFLLSQTVVFLSLGNHRNKLLGTRLFTPLSRSLCSSLCKLCNLSAGAPSSEASSLKLLQGEG